MGYRVVIPSRYASQRLPGKPLMDIAGKPMIRHVWERAQEAGADEVIVATDDKRILRACEDFSALAVTTSAAHVSGTDRIAEVAGLYGWDENDIIVNVQGDEPLIPPAAIAQVARMLEARPDAEMATLCTPIHALSEYIDPNVVKLVRRDDGSALYFSRAPIPWHREGAETGLASQRKYQDSLRHVGIYAYRAGALQELANTPACLLEATEKLEQLRALYIGFTILTEVAVEVPGPGVDTREHLDAVRRLFL
jgi:3-deoxy-manno-octulosonate cytidylyltransferase (CMP-KDO synthetase)